MSTPKTKIFNVLCHDIISWLKIIYSKGYGCYLLLLSDIAKSVSTFKQSNAIKQPTL
jgi:hypothetical protein